MPATPHTEHHFTAPEAVRDVVIGMSDGLTVPFALAAGISGALASSPHASALVVTAGLAEIAAGSIAMGLGGYLAARTDIGFVTPSGCLGLRPQAPCLRRLSVGGVGSDRCGQPSRRGHLEFA